MYSIDTIDRSDSSDFMAQPYIKSHDFPQQSIIVPWAKQLCQ
jgi:hypothetical protein